VSRVTQRLSFLDPLVNHHVALRLPLILVKVLLVLVKCHASGRSPILLVAVSLMVLVLRGDHLCTGLLTVLLGPETWVESLLLIVHGVKGVQDTRVTIPL